MTDEQPNEDEQPKEPAPRKGAAGPVGLTILNVPESRRYEARVGDALAGWVDYGRVRNRLVAVHTEVPAEFGGQGIGSALVRHVLADARANGLKITPRCPLFAAHFERHPEDADLLPEGRGA